MNTNVILEYVNYATKYIHKFLKIILEQHYNKDMAEEFIKKYIRIRYYKDYYDTDITDITIIVNVSLLLLAKQKTIEQPENEQAIKHLFNAFQFVLKIDDVEAYDKKILLEKIKEERLEYGITKELSPEMEPFLKEIDQKKKEYLKLFQSPQFELHVKKCLEIPNGYFVDIIEHVKIPKLYSEYAIKKVFTTGVIAEDKMFIMHKLLSVEILQALIMNDDIKRYYIVPFTVSILEKKKKLERLLQVINHVTLLERISLHITYKEYISEKKVIDQLIKQGIPFSITLDETYDNENVHYSTLIIFKYIFLPQTVTYYEQMKQYKGEIPLIIEKQ